MARAGHFLAEFHLTRFEVRSSFIKISKSTETILEVTYNKIEIEYADTAG